MKVQSILGKLFLSVMISLALPTVGLSQESITIKHGRGETTVKKNPEKVVIFDIGTLETYHELGIPVYGVLNNVPEYLDQYKSDQYLKLGGIKAPDIEAIKLAKPDLIIISGRQGNAYDSLSSIAPTLFLGVNTDDYWNSFEDNVNTIAKIHGKEALAEKKLQELSTKKDLVVQKSKTDTNKGLVMLQVRGNHSAFGSQSRFGFVHDVLGVRPVASIETTGHTGSRVNEEYIKKVNPDYIFIIDRDSATGGEKKPTDELLTDEMKRSNAYLNNHIITLTGNVWYTSGGGLISVDRMISEVGEQLYTLSL